MVGYSLQGREESGTTEWLHLRSRQDSLTLAFKIQTEIVVLPGYNVGEKSNCKRTCVTWICQEKPFPSLFPSPLLLVVFLEKRKVAYYLKPSSMPLFSLPNKWNHNSSNCESKKSRRFPSYLSLSPILLNQLRDNTYRLWFLTTFQVRYFSMFIIFSNWSNHHYSSGLMQ